MKKPSWFRLLDLITFGFGGLLTVGLTIYAMLNHATGPAGWQYACWATAATFFAIYGVVVWQRKKWLDSFVWYPTFGFMVQCENWKPYNSVNFDSAVLTVIEQWSNFYPNAESIVLSDINWVWFKKGLNETTMNPVHQTVKGFTLAGTHVMNVDYDTPEDALSKTAFAHKLGHVIYGNATGDWNQESAQAFMAAHGLP